MLLILIALGLAIFGLVWLGRTLTPGQRIVMVLAFIFGVVWLVFSLINGGVLGRAAHLLASHLFGRSGRHTQHRRVRARIAACYFSEYVIIAAAHAPAEN